MNPIQKSVDSDGDGLTDSENKAKAQTPTTPTAMAMVSTTEMKSPMVQTQPCLIRIPMASQMGMK